MSNPAPETHRYIGMWRPPFEAIFPIDQQQARGGLEIKCPCETHRWKISESGFLCDWWTGAPAIGEKKAALDHWLAGHFDEPQYEAKDLAIAPDDAPKCFVCGKLAFAIQPIAAQVKGGGKWKHCDPPVCLSMCSDHRLAEIETRTAANAR